MLKAICQHSESQGLSASQRFVARLPIREDACEVGNLGDPPPIRFSFNFDCQAHQASTGRVLTRARWAI
jgi:hypothetical protein